MGSGTTGAIGAGAEKEALNFLVHKGLKPITRNFRCRGGEIDLIMLDGECLAFIEVRFRKSTRFSSPGPTVDFHKQRKILRTAAVFLASKQSFARHTVRFDVVAITGREDVDIEWIQDAFRPNDSSL